MRKGALVLVLVTILGAYACAPAKLTVLSAAPIAELRSTPASSLSKVDFTTQIRPILEAKCQPCHFSGGKVYQRMPFDRPETIKTLGTKLFTRIKDENDRKLIRDFLSQN